LIFHESIFIQQVGKTAGQLFGFVSSYLLLAIRTRNSEFILSIAALLRISKAIEAIKSAAKIHRFNDLFSFINQLVTAFHGEF
jgi:hypothetical protein